MPIDLGMALKLIGGAPHMKVGSVIAEKLPITKMLDSGPIGSLLSSVLKDGPGALMQNPIAAVTGQLQGAIQSATGALSGIAGAGGLISALTGAGGLSSALSSLSGAASLLSGVTMPGAGQFGLLDAITHSSITDMLGSAMPSSMGLDAVLGPLTSGGIIGDITGALPGVVANVVSGAMSVADATAWVTAQTASLAGVTAASTTAMQSAQDIAGTLVSISSTAAAIVAAPPAIQAIIPSIVRPAALATMRRALATHLEN